MAGQTKSGLIFDEVMGPGRASINLPTLPSMTLLFIQIVGGTASIDLEISEDAQLFIKVATVTTNAAVQFAIPASILGANITAISGATVTITYRTIALENIPSQTLIIYDGSNAVSPLISTADHGSLSGLGDNDHPQYALAADFAGVAGDIFYIDSGGNIAKLPIGTTGQVLTVSAGGLPEWA